MKKSYPSNEHTTHRQEQQLIILAGTIHNFHTNKKINSSKFKFKSSKGYEPKHCDWNIFSQY